MKFREKLSILDKHLEGRDYVTLRHITLADVSILASLSFSEACRFDFTAYPALHRWMSRIKIEIPGYKRVNDEPMERFTAYMTEIISRVNQAGLENDK